MKKDLNKVKINPNKRLRDLKGFGPKSEEILASVEIHSIEDFMAIDPFELYATLPATVKPREGTAYCARLVRKLMGDERILFLSNPLTWNS